MGDAHGEYVWQVRSYECGPDGKARMDTICNYLQEAASLHAEEMGFSKSDFESEGKDISWVLTRLRVKMFRYPEWEEDVRVVTYPRGGRRIVAWRDFELFDAQGGRMGVATSEWMIINLATRKIVPIPEYVFAAANTVRPPVLGEAPFAAKIRWPEEAKRLMEKTFRARRCDIDLNGHVNNVHYVEWLLEALPEPVPACGELELVFRSETFAGDDVCVSSCETGTGGFILRCASPTGQDHVVARMCPLENMDHSVLNGGSK